MGDLRKPTRRVKARGKLVGERLIVDKAIRMCRVDRLLVKKLRIELAAFDAGNLGARQGRSVFEIVRAILRPYFELSVVSRQGREMLLALDGRSGIAARGVGERT